MLNSEADEYILELRRLCTDCPNLTPEFGGMLAQAAAVCLEDQGHAIKVSMKVGGHYEVLFRIVRTEVTAVMQTTFADPEEATEWGATALAILMILDLTGYNVVERSKKGTGFDYWLGKGEDDSLPFQNKARLEISGILQGDENIIRGRVRQKVKQTDPSDGFMLPAFIVVVEFGQPTAQVIRK